MREALGEAAAGAEIVIGGVSYIPEVADTRNSPTETLVSNLLASGTRVRVHDPIVRTWIERPDIPIFADLAAALAGADGAVFAVPHPEYQAVTATTFTSTSVGPGFSSMLRTWSPMRRHGSYTRPAGASPASARVTGAPKACTGSGGVPAADSRDRRCRVRGLSSRDAPSEDESDEITIDDFSRGTRDLELDGLAAKPNVRVQAADLTNPDSWQALGGGFDEVYHLAALIGVEHVLTRPQEVVRINALATIYLLEWLIRGGGNRLVFTSTSEAFA